MSETFKKISKIFLILFFIFSLFSFVGQGNKVFAGRSAVCMGQPYCDTGSDPGVCYPAQGAVQNCDAGYDAVCIGGWGESCCSSGWGETAACVPNTPIPDICIDPTATNYGGPAPCEYTEYCEDVTALNYSDLAPCTYFTCNDPTAVNYGQNGTCIGGDPTEDPGEVCACISNGVCVTSASRCSAPTESCGDLRVSNAAGEECDLGSGNGACPSDCSNGSGGVPACHLNNCGTCELTADGKGSPYFSDNPADLVKYGRRLENNTCYWLGSPVDSLCFYNAPTTVTQGRWRYEVYGGNEPGINDGVCRRDNGTPGSPPGQLLFVGPGDNWDADKGETDRNLQDYSVQTCVRKYSCLIDNPISKNGVCGTRNTTYPIGVIAYPAGSTYCAVGTPTASPAFPSSGASASWFCNGVGVGSSPSQQCTVTATDTQTRPSVLVVKNPVVGGTVTSNDGKIACGADCSEIYNGGENVTLTAKTTSSYWKFNGWAGACSGVGQCVLNVTGPKTVIANFAPRLFIYEEF